MEQITSKDGTVIGFRRSGAGPPLVLVHGTTADHSRWAPVSAQLGRHFAVYALDRRGRGASGDSPDYDIMREAEDVAAVVEAIGGPVFLLGHSYGAICSLEASMLTDRVSRLILYEPPLPVGFPHYPPGVHERIQALVDGGEFEGALEVFFRDVVKMPEQELQAYRQLPVWNVRIQLAPTIAREIVVDRAYTFEPRRFARLRVPTMLLLGGDSPPMFSRPLEVLDSVLPDSRLVILPGQRHVAMDAVPELFLNRVLPFLSE